MSVEEKAKKFLAEPLVWVSMAMVGVVMVGPMTANIARNLVGGDRNRGDVDQHGEALTDKPLQKASVAKAVAPSAEGSRTGNSPTLGDGESLIGGAAAIENATRDSGQSAGEMNRGSKLTAADIRQEVRDATLRNKRLAGETSSEQVVGESDPNFDIDKMVSEVEAAVRESEDSEAAEPGDAKADRGLGAVDSLRSADSSDSLEAMDELQPIAEPKAALGSKDAKLPTAKGGSLKKDRLPPPVDKLPVPQQSREIAAQDSSSDGAPDEPSQDQNEAVRMGKQGSGSKSNAMTKDLVAEDGTNAEIKAETNPEPEDASEAFEPLGDPLTFESGSSSKSDSKKLETGGSWDDDRQKHPGDDAPASPPESGDQWWKTMVSQQFWPGRQAQFADLDSVVFVALQRSAQLQILNDQPRIERTFVQQREADFDWAAFVEASWNSVSEPVRSELQTGSRTGRYEQEELRVGSGLQKRLARGGQLRVGSTIGTLDNNSVFLSPPDQGTSTFSLDYRQPLLRGRGREVAQSQIVLARLNVEASEHAVKQEMQRYLLEVVTAYWALYRARGVLAQRHRSVTRAASVVQRLSENTESAANHRQLIRAKAAAATRQSEVIDAEYIVADAQEALMNLTHGDSLVDASFIEIIPTDAPPQLTPPHDLSSVTQLAISNRQEVKQVLAEIKAASVRQVIALDGLKPQLDAIISSYVTGVRGNKDVGNAIYDQFSAGDPSYSVGMAFEIPIGRRAANAGLKRQEIRSRLLQNKLRQTLGDVTLSARSAFRDVYRLAAIVGNNQQVVSQSARDLNSIEQQNVWLSKDDQSAGLYLNDLLLSQERLVAAEQNLLDSQAQLAVAYVALKRATGELLQDHVVGCDAGGCDSCGETTCGCSSVGQVTYDEPAGRYWVEEGRPGATDGMMEGARPMSPPQREEPSILLERGTPPTGVTPVPPNADTAVEWEDPSTYLNSAKRLPARAAKWLRR